MFVKLIIPDTYIGYKRNQETVPNQQNNQETVPNNKPIMQSESIVLQKNTTFSDTLACMSPPWEVTTTTCYMENDHLQTNDGYMPIIILPFVNWRHPDAAKAWSTKPNQSDEVSRLKLVSPTLVQHLFENPISPRNFDAERIEKDTEVYRSVFGVVDMADIAAMQLLQVKFVKVNKPFKIAQFDPEEFGYDGEYI
jgi:hypothetical protein